MNDNAYAIIMAGGKGERFWPLSTSKRPKQMLSLVGGEPLLAAATRRLKGVVPAPNIFVVTSAGLVDAAREAAPRVPPGNVIGEPFGRDTAAACALGAVLAKARDPGAVLCVLTADHVILDEAVFATTLDESLAVAAAHDVLITIGIQPLSASTGFGYIEAGEPFAHVGTIDIFRAARFVEKPDPATAKTYLESGNFCWNSGMFVWSLKAFEAALARCCPALTAMAAAVLPTVDTPDFFDTVAAEYAKLEKISVDYALMEKADNILMVRGTFGWDDVGSWPALANHFDADADGNVVIGTAESLDSTGNIVVSQERLTALIGVRDLVVVQAEGATLVCPKDRAQDVKAMVQRLAARGDCDPVL